MPAAAQLFRASIVVLSDGNNPRILNPDFLSNSGIVPSNWKSQDVLVLPPVARVKYTNSVEFTLEENRLSIMCSDLSKIDWAESLPRMIVSFLSTLPHVAYRGVGINLESTVEPKFGGKLRTLVGLLMKDGKWLHYQHEADVLKVQVQYALEDAILNLSISSRQLDGAEAPDSSAIDFHANFHSDFGPDQLTERKGFINTLGKRYEQLTELVNLFPLSEEEE